MSNVNIKCALVTSVVPVGATLHIKIDITDRQRWAAVAELLGCGISEQDAYEGMKALFPDWFADQPLPEVSESSFGDFESVRGAL